MIILSSHVIFQYEELQSKGNFSREDTVTMLTAHQGNVEAAFQVRTNWNT